MSTICCYSSHSGESDKNLTSLVVLILPKSCFKSENQEELGGAGKAGRGLLWNASEKYDAVHSPRKACCIKGCAAFKHVALVAGTRNTVDSSVLHKKKKKPAGPGAKSVH